MSTTLNDIAERAGCSPATVSRALNGTAGVDPALRRRILTAVRTLESATEEESPARRGRPRGSVRLSDVVDVVVFRREPLEPLVRSASGVSAASLTDASPDLLFSPRFRLSNDFYSRIIDGMLSVLTRQGLKLFQQMRCDLLDPAFLGDLKRARHRGLLLLGEPDPQVADFAAACPSPLVLVDILGTPGYPVVTTDNGGGTRQAMDHLLALGHRDIGFAGNPANPSLRERFLAYCGALAEAGAATRPEWHYTGPSHIRETAAGVAPILRRKRRPTAFFCAGDFYAMGVLEAAREAGLRVPEDLSVVGFDDVDAAALLAPPLTTVRVPNVQLGACAADLLLRGAQPETRDLWQHCELRCRTELIVRASTRALAGNKRKAGPHA